MRNRAVAAPTIPESVQSDSPPEQLRVVRRDGSVSEFDAAKISVALTKAFLNTEGAASGSSRVRELVEDLTAQVIAALRRFPTPAVHVEQIQDQVELALMRGEHHKVAR
ncbi:MAG: ribonucleoside-diphosphate reductase subunit alpha, partial [Mesorhizobium sp.]|nr:ribonucleoside-diphosphate reductase subunit alpha [Mesorhizobium sp.]